MILPRASSPPFRAHVGGAAYLLFTGLAWLVSLGFLVWAARVAYLEGYVYEIPKRFSGDFVQTINLAFPQWFDGTNIFYGPVFVLEYQFLVAPHRLEPIDFSRANFLLLGIAFVCTWLATFGWRRPRLAVLVLALWLAHHATVEALANTSHLEFVELAAIGLALLLAARERPTSSGLALGVAAATKTLPVLFLPYLAITRRWRMLAGAVVVSAGLLLAACWIQSVSPWEGAIALIDQRGNLTDIEPTEYSYTLRADVARILARGEDVLSPEQERLAITLHWMLASTIMLLVGFVLWWTRHTRGHEGLYFGVLAATMLVVAPSAHPASYIFLLPGFTAGLAELLSRRPSLQRFQGGVALAAGFVFSGFDQPFVASQRLLRIGDVVQSHWLTWHLPTLALLATLGTLCALLVSTRRDPPKAHQDSYALGPAGNRSG